MKPPGPSEIMSPRQSDTMSPGVQRPRGENSPQQLDPTQRCRRCRVCHSEQTFRQIAKICLSPAL